MTKNEQIDEIAKCFRSPAYFTTNYCQIYDALERDWIPFTLWPEQADTLAAIQDHRLVVILKARQLGLTWLVLAYSLWQVLFHPAATVLLFSRRDDEAIYLLDDRLKGMYSHLPEWMREDLEVVASSAHEWGLSNGSVARAFPTSAGDSYTATLAIVDEADLVPDLNRLMRAVKPTIDNGGRMILLSRSDKTKPASEFKNIYRAAREGLTDWVSVFLPWYVHPNRDEAWYEVQRRDIMQRTGSLDDLYEQYPATDTEALAARTLDKRLAPAWIEQCYQDEQPARYHKDAPALPGLLIYRPPEEGHRYVIGADPAEGNPTSDDSALEVLDVWTGEEVACLAGKYQPSTLAAHADAIGQWYNKASIMCERNNHGHAVLLWLKDHAKCSILNGHDGKPGWLSSSQGKALLYNAAADAFRNSEVTLHSFKTMTQLQAIEGSTLRAPEGEHDDCADAFALAVVGRVQAGRQRRRASSFQG